MLPAGERSATFPRGVSFEGKNSMLILTRRIGETITIGAGITVTILGLKGHQVRIGTDAPKNIEVHREEVRRKIMSTAAKQSTKGA